VDSSRKASDLRSPTEISERPRALQLGRKLLAERHFGRLAIPDFGGPVIVPVNYVFDQDLTSSEPTPDPSQNP
jgi:hypothetical protein